MPHSQQIQPQTKLDKPSTVTTFDSFFAQRALPLFLVDQAVKEILQELAAGQLANRDVPYFIKHCLESITPGDKEFLALFRWGIEAVPLRGKPTIPIIPHMISPRLRRELISGLMHYRSWDLVDDPEWDSMSNGWEHGPDLIFQRFRDTVSLVAGYMGTSIRTWDD
ncbi:hypothetical protein ACHAQD_011813 [Fusarium lateritium]